MPDGRQYRDGRHTDGARQSGSRPLAGRRAVLRAWSLALLAAAVASFDWVPGPAGSEARVAARAWDVGGLFGGGWEGDKDPVNPFTLYGTVQCVVGVGGGEWGVGMRGEEGKGEWEAQGPHTPRDASAARVTMAWDGIFAAWKKYYIERLEGEKVLSRAKGFTATACVAALDNAAETPELQALPIGAKVSVIGNAVCQGRGE
ncbi:unnamed protein product [Closterium sp. Naga37s-1]|nr:unnamed protein product [Closterium sp. Naga37s-1]